MKKSKNLKNLLWVLLVLAICFVVFYFVWAFLRLNDRGLSESTFSGKTYQSLNGETVLTFGNFISIQHEDDSFMVIESKYEGNIFSFETDDETLYFFAIYGNLLYCNAWNVYVYEVIE